MSKKRPDGDGPVRKRSDGRREGRIVIGHKEDSTPIFKSVFAKTQKKLMPKLHAAIDEYRGVDLIDKLDRHPASRERKIIAISYQNTRAINKEMFESRDT